uniref:SIS domain-containing protein n=1 Tax=Peronospora matthiolae TaxID=2874970 RepID=A0AAV1U1X3_9STRA
MAALGRLRSMALRAQKNVIRHTVSIPSLCRGSPRDASPGFSRRSVAWPTHFSTVKSLNEAPSGTSAPASFHSIASDVFALQNLFQVFSSDSSIALNFTQCVMRVLKCHDERNRVFVTGLGKSGAVAQRLASTLSSISISSQWIHGGEWVHGELGGLKHGDMVIIMSHSGRTTELLSLPDMFRKAGCSVMAVVGDGCSPLSQQCDWSIIAPAEDETSCPVPSRSIIVQEAICNALIQHLIENMGGGDESLKSSHPGGAIGARFANRTAAESLFVSKETQV